MFCANKLSMLFKTGNPGSSTEPGVGGGTNYEVPEKFKKLHQLALQHVHQVRMLGGIWSMEYWDVEYWDVEYWGVEYWDVE